MFFWYPVSPGFSFLFLLAVVIFLIWRWRKRKRVEEYGDPLLGEADNVECVISVKGTGNGIEVSARTSTLAQSLQTQTEETFLDGAGGVRFLAVIDSLILPPYPDLQIVTKSPLEYGKTFWLFAEKAGQHGKNNPEEEWGPIMVTIIFRKNEGTFGGDFRKTAYIFIKYPDGTEREYTQDLEESSRAEIECTVGG